MNRRCSLPLRLRCLLHELQNISCSSKYSTTVKGPSDEIGKKSVVHSESEKDTEVRSTRGNSILESVIANMDKRLKFRKDAGASSAENSGTKLGSYSQLKSMYKSRYRQSERTPAHESHRHAAEGSRKDKDFGVNLPVYSQNKHPVSESGARNVSDKFSRKTEKMEIKTSEAKVLNIQSSTEHRKHRENLSETERKPEENLSETDKENLNKKEQIPENNMLKSNWMRNVRYEPYWYKKKLMEALEEGKVLKGTLEIFCNGSVNIGFVDVGDKEKIFIETVSDRNRALHGDVVVVETKAEKSWKVNRRILRHMEKKQEGKSANSNFTSVPAATATDCSGNVDATPTCDSITMNAETPDQSAALGATVNTLAATDDIVQIDGKESLDSDSDPDVIIEQEEEVKLEDISCNSLAESLTNALMEGVVKSDNDVTNDLDLVESSSDASFSDVSVSEDENDPSTKKQFLQMNEVGKSPIVKKYLTKSQDQSKKKRKLFQRTGKIVGILEEVHPRKCAGNVFIKDNGSPMFLPLDLKLPPVKLALDSLPQQNFKERPEDYQDTLFICNIDTAKWKPAFTLPSGNLIHCLGKAGEIQPETDALLLQYNVDNSEFSEKALKSLPMQQLPWTIPQKEIASRRDFRKNCVFTIDPATAKDLDDALSIEVLPDGNYEVGVHIADVSYFLTEGTELDKVARERCTSVYLVHQVVPMLPKILCEELCSLNPDVDRLTMSVVWKMSEAGEILDEWFGRTVIRSCCKLTYEHAQGFIEQPDKGWTTDQLPPISEEFSIQHIKQRVLNLQKIAVNLRKSRFENGALSLNMVKLSFVLDPTSGMPNGYNFYQAKDSNKLVEEFMLLANMAVARKIYKAFPKKAMLRQHEAPEDASLQKLTERCKLNNITVDASSSKSLHNSLAEQSFGNDEFATARYDGLVFLWISSMKEAKYFCTGSVVDEEHFRHYALSVPFYTHFTSPIRRYVDVMVHRTLSAALKYCNVTNLNSDAIQQQADKCNVKKTASRKVSQASAEMFFALYVKECGAVEEKAMVVTIDEKAITVFFPRLGVRKTVYCSNLPVKKFRYKVENKQNVMYLTWGKTDEQQEDFVQKITPLSLVDGIMTPGQKRLDVETQIKRPPDEDMEDSVVEEINSSSQDLELTAVQ